MEYAAPKEYADEEALQVKCSNHQVVEKKERLVRKAFLFVVLACAVVCSVRMRASLKNEPLSSHALFGERSLAKGFCGLCGKKDDPTPPPPPPPADEPFVDFTWGSTQSGQTVASGASKKYKSVAPSTARPFGTITVDSGRGDFFMSATQTKPAVGADSDTECCYEATTSVNCSLKATGADYPFYVWFTGKGGTDTTFTIRLYPMGT